MQNRHLHLIAAKDRICKTTLIADQWLDNEGHSVTIQMAYHRIRAFGLNSYLPHLMAAWESGKDVRNLTLFNFLFKGCAPSRGSYRVGCIWEFIRSCSSDAIWTTRITLTKRWNPIFFYIFSTSKTCFSSMIVLT